MQAKHVAERWAKWCHGKWEQGCGRKRSLEGRTKGRREIQGERHRVGVMARKKDIGWPHLGQTGCFWGSAGWEVVGLVLCREAVCCGLHCWRCAWMEAKSGRRVGARKPK